MKKILLLQILILVSIFAIAKKHQIKGRIITRTGTLNVTLLIPGTKKSVDVTSLMREIQYLNKDDKKVQLKPTQAKEIFFEFNKDTIHLVSTRVQWTKRRSERFFLRLIIDGKIKLYHYYYTKSSTRSYGSGGTNGSINVTDVTTRGTSVMKIVQKGTRSGKKISMLAIRKGMRPLIVDCKKLHKDLSKLKTSLSYSLESIIEYYNTNCSK